ncbi:MAG: GNAT family N-acetyltransferase [Bacteroidota bacterium]
MNIRQAKNEDARRISYLIHKNTDANPNDYTIEQIKAWKKYTTPANISKQLMDRKIFCAFENGKLIGTIALKENYILGFYVNPTVRGKGIGSKLLNHLEDYASTNGVKKLYLTSTPSAFPFYQNKGYTKKEEVIVTIYDVDFREVEMEKALDI